MRSVQLFLLFFLIFITPVVYAQQKEEKAVRTAFDSYKSAILNDKGAEAVDYLDSRTVKYYGEMAELARSADSGSVDRLSTQDKFIVLSIRHRANREEVLNFTGESLLVYCLNNGMIGKNSVSKNSIGEVTINEHFASGQLLSNGQKTPLSFHFYKENDSWKIDLTSIFAVTDAAFEQVVAKSGMEENAFLLSTLEQLTGKKPGQEVWHPVK